MAAAYLAVRCLGQELRRVGDPLLPLRGFEGGFTLVGGPERQRSIAQRLQPNRARALPVDLDGSSHHDRTHRLILHPSGRSGQRTRMLASLLVGVAVEV